MTKLIILPFFIALIAIRQNATYLKAKVLKIKELDDCFVFTTIKNNSADTLYLVSVKDSLKISGKHSRNKIFEGKKYLFMVSDPGKSLSIPDKNFRLRVGRTVVWRGDEEVKKYPLLIKNTKGLYIVSHKR